MRSPGLSKYSITSGAWRTQLMVAFALMAVIPMLTFGYIVAYYVMPNLATRESLFLVIVLNLVLSLSGFYLLFRNVALLSQFRRHLQSIAQGDLHASSIRDGPEVTSMSAAVDAIAERLRQDRDRLQELSESLEQKVRERTTALVSAEKALKESEARYRQLYEFAPTPYHTLTPDGRITQVNRKWCETLGYTKDEVVGKSIFDFVIEAERSEAHRSFEAKKQTVDTFTRGRQRRYLDKKGNERVFVTNDYFSIGIDGSVMTVHTTMEEVTDLKQTEEDLRKANMKLSAALEQLKRTQQEVIQHERLGAVGQLASGVAHDFNNALMPILGFSDLMLKKPDLLQNSTEATEMLRDINRAAKDAAEAVGRLRSFYRASYTSKRAHVSLEAVVDSTVSLTQPKWKEEASAHGRAL